MSLNGTSPGEIPDIRKDFYLKLNFCSAGLENKAGFPEVIGNINSVVSYLEK